MKGIFNWDSPLIQKLALLTNLVALNILWLLCCIPVFTAGAATTALYYTVIQYADGESDEIFRPFFRSFRQNFKQATLLWVPLLMLLVLLVFDGLFLAINGGNPALWIAFIALTWVYLMLHTHLFPLLARFEMKTKALLSTAVSLFMLHLPTSLLMAAMNLLPMLLMLFAPADFLRWSILWIGLWFSLVAYLNGKMLLKIWNKHIPNQNAETVSAE